MISRGILTFLLLWTSCYAQSIAELIRKSDVEFDKQNYVKSKDYLDKALSLYPKNAEVYMSRAFTNFALDEYKACISDVNKSKPESQGLQNKYALIKIRGESYYQLEQWEKSLVDFDTYLGIYSDNAYVICLKANSLQNLKKYKEAIVELEFARRLKKLSHTDSLNINKGFAFNYFTMEDYKTSEKYLLEAFKLDSTDIDVQEFLIQTYYYESKYDSSDVFINLRLRTDPAQLGANYISAMNCYYRNEYEKAIGKFNKYLSLKGKSADAYYYLSICKSKLNDIDGSLADAKSYIRLQPKDAYGYNQVAWMLFLTKKYDEALAYSNKSLLLKPDYANSIDTRACINYKLGYTDKAIEEFNKALSLDSTLTGSYYYRGMCYLKKGKVNEACIDWKKVLADKEYKEKVGEKPASVLLTEHCRD